MLSLFLEFTFQGLETIEGLFIEISESCQIKKNYGDSLTEMKRLRLLKVYTHIWSVVNVDLPDDFELSSSKLRYLHFQNYPLKSLPTNFDANNLVELNLPHSNVIQIWKDSGVLLLLLLLLLHQ